MPHAYFIYCFDALLIGAAFYADARARQAKGLHVNAAHVVAILFCFTGGSGPAEQTTRKHLHLVNKLEGAGWVAVPEGSLSDDCLSLSSNQRAAAAAAETAVAAAAGSSSNGSKTHAKDHLVDRSLKASYRKN